MERPSKLSRSAIMHRLAMLWFANVYPHYVRSDAAPFSPPTPPPEYLPPYPNPWYWPKNTSQKKPTSHRMTALEAVQTPERPAGGSIEFPSWLEFWQGKPPAWPLPETPNVIVPQIPIDNFLRIFEETDKLRKPYRITPPRRNAGGIQPHELAKAAGLGIKGGMGVLRQSDAPAKREDVPEGTGDGQPPAPLTSSEEGGGGNPRWYDPPQPPTTWTHPTSPFEPVEPPILAMDTISAWEALCCIGLNPEDHILEAIFFLRFEYGYGGPLCEPGMIESVGFWLIEPSDTESIKNYWEPARDTQRRWIGEARVTVHDIPRNIGTQPTTMVDSVGLLHYSVRVPLNEDDKKFIRECYRNARLPQLHCVLAHGQVVTDNNFMGNGIPFGDTMTVEVQYPILGARVVSLNQLHIINPKIADTTGQLPTSKRHVFPIHVAQLPTGKIVIFSLEWEASSVLPLADKVPSRIGNNEGDEYKEALIKYERDVNKAKTGKAYSIESVKRDKDGKPIRVNGVLQYVTEKFPSRDENTARLFSPFSTPALNLDDGRLIHLLPPFRAKINVKKWTDKDVEYWDKLKVQIENVRNPRVNTTNPKTGLPYTIKDEYQEYYDEEQHLFHADRPHFPTFCSGHSVLFNGNIFVAGGTLGRAYYALRYHEEGTLGDPYHHVGHDIGINETTVFDWFWEEWAPGPNMRSGRWYPSTVALPDKSVLIVAGHPSPEYNPYHQNIDIEYYLPEGASYIEIPPYEREPVQGRLLIFPYQGALFGESFIPKDNYWGVPLQDRDNKFNPTSTDFTGYYPRTFLLPDGTVFFAKGVYSFFNPQTVSDAINETKYGFSVQEPFHEIPSKRWVPTSKLKDEFLFYPWTMKFEPNYNLLDGNPRESDTSGTWEKVTDGDVIGNLNQSTGALLPLTLGNGYKPTIFMMEYFTVWVCSPLADDAEQRKWRILGYGDKDNPDVIRSRRLDEFATTSRSNGQAVLLADGTLLLAGGGDEPNWINFPKYMDGIPKGEIPSFYDNIVRANKGSKEYSWFYDAPLGTEIYDPFEGAFGSWKKGEPLNEPRQYHSTFILMYDGSVLIGGGIPVGGRTKPKKDLYEPYGDTNYYDPEYVHNFERYYPEYCAKPRPIISFEPVEYQAGDTVRIEFFNDSILPNAKELRHRIKRVGFMRLSSSTHGFVYDQRYVEMPYSITDYGIDIIISETLGLHPYKNVLPPGPYFVFILFDNGWVSITRPSVVTRRRLPPSDKPRMNQNIRQHQEVYTLFII